jgi:hypothetical protein
MAHPSGLMMLLFTVLGEAAGGAPLEFRAVDADSGEPVPGVLVRQLPATWEVRFLLQRPRNLQGLVGRFTDRSGVIRCDSVSRGTYFFETEGYVAVDVRKNWFGLKVYEEPYKYGTDVRMVDGVYLVPLRRKEGPSP